MYVVVVELCDTDLVLLYTSYWNK